MPKAIRVHEYGGPEVLHWEEVEMPEPGPGEVLLRQTSVGLNYIDTYNRTGLYPVPLPFTPGIEGCGVIEAQGEGADNFKEGTRVAYCMGPVGAYAEYRVIPQHHLIQAPKFLNDEEASAFLLKALTARYLARRSYALQPGHRILVHAAAGGVGLYLCELAKFLGATVIGVVGSEEKTALAEEAGCDFVINYQEEDIVEKVREYTEGRMLHVVYDSVGQATFIQSLDCLMPCGLLVSYGQASGPVPPFDLGLLREKGSLYVTRPILKDFITSQEEYLVQAADMLDLVKRGALHIRIGQTYPLAEAVQAHRDLEARKTVANTVLTV